MEISEAFSRIIGRHFRLIVILLVAGLAGAFMLHRGDVPQYQATARLVLDINDPQNTAESAVISDTARALATGPAQVREVLSREHLQRNATDVALKHVTVTAMGSSGVLQLAVTDPDPQAAVTIANALAAEVVSVHRDLTDATFDRTINDFDTQIAAAQHRISALDAQLTRLGNSPAATVLGRQAVAGTSDNLLRTRADLVNQINTLQDHEATVQADHATRPQGGVVDAAIPPAIAVPGRMVTDLSIGALLGLVVGIGVAACLEMLRPSIVGRDAIARSVGAPVLAELPTPPDRWGTPDLAEAAMHIQLAMVAAGVTRVELMTLDRHVDLPAVTAMLEPALGPVAVGLGIELRGGRPTRDERDTRRSEPAPVAGGDGRGRAGLVLVTPSVVRLSDLSKAGDFVAFSGWPLLGLVVYPVQSARPALARLWMPHDDGLDDDASANQDLGVV